MGGIYGCGCKEVYRLPHYYLSLLLLYLFFFAAVQVYNAPVSSPGTIAGIDAPSILTCPYDTKQRMFLFGHLGCAAELQVHCTTKR